MSTGMNMANREVCDVNFYDLATNKLVSRFDTANVTGLSLSGDSVYAMAKGARRIAFQNPQEGTLTITCQVMPFEAYAMLSDGTISTSAVVPVRKVIKATTAKELAFDEAGTIVDGSIGVVVLGNPWITDNMIEVTKGTGKLTADSIEADKEYEVVYLVSKTSGVKTVTFDKDHVAKGYKIVMSTNFKDENDVLIPFIITVYKATPQRNIEMSFSSEGDPMEMEWTFDILESKEKKFVEITEDMSE